MAALKRKVHWNLSGSHHTLDSDNAFVGGGLYVTGSLSGSVVSASVGVSASQVQSTQLSASFAGIDTLSGSHTFGDPLGTGLLVDTNTVVTNSFFVVQDSDLLVALNGNDHTFGVTSGSLDPNQAVGFKIVGATTADYVDVWLNGSKVTDNLTTPVSPVVTASLRLLGTGPELSSGSITFTKNNSPIVWGSYFSANEGIGKFTMNTTALRKLNNPVDGTQMASWTHIVTFVSGSDNKLQVLDVNEIDYITGAQGTGIGSSELANWDVNIANLSPTGFQFEVTSSNNTDWFSEVTNGYVFLGAQGSSKIPL